VAEDRQESLDAALAAAARHALHDEELVAAYAAGGLGSDDEAAQACSLVERCGVCRDLHRDLVAIGTAFVAEARFTSRAPRDFRLTVADAQRLGGHVRRRRPFASLRRSMLAFARPVGATLATFGVIGVLVGSATFGGAASTPLAAQASDAATYGPAEMTGGGANPDGVRASGDMALGPEASSAAGRTDTDPPIDREVTPAGPSPLALLLGGSVAILIAGVILLGVSFRRGRGGTAGN
jgi:hypothetical protein